MIDDSSFWPNGVKVVNGHGRFYKLGTNKVKVPTTGWPKGTKFVSPFVYDEDDNLVGFVDTKAMTSTGDAIYLPYELIEVDFSNITQGKLQIHAPKATVKKASWKGSNERIDIPEAQFKYKGCKTVSDVKNVQSELLADISNGTWSEPLWDLTDGDNMFNGCYNLTAFSSDLSSLTNGKYMFIYCSNLESFSSDLSSLMNGRYMFRYCRNLESFSSDLSSLTDGYQMFYNCRNLTSFNSDLSSLTYGRNMFAYCSKLTSFSSDLSSLTNGSRMFDGCDNLTSFTSDLPSLTDGGDMFYDSGLESFSSDLSSLTNGAGMFKFCSNLTTFSSDLSSLTNGSSMFYNCKLDTASIQNIADTINTYSGKIHIGIGNSTPNEQEKAAFNTIASKGWTVYVNGSLYTPTSPASITTLDENGIEKTTPIPFWAKPVPATEETASYIDANSNFYNILGGQFIYGDSLETYGMFISEEDAAANMRLTSYTKPQTEIEKQ